MPARSELRKRRRKIFFIALAALIFAETGYILGTTGLINIFLGPKAPDTSSIDVVLNTARSYVFYNGSVTEGPPPKYRDAYVYVFYYQPGVSLPSSAAAKLVLDSAERPVYVVPIPIQGTGVLIDDFNIPTTPKHPIVVLTYSHDQLIQVDTWVYNVLNKFNVGLGQTGAVRITVNNGVVQGVIVV